MDDKVQRKVLSAANEMIEHANIGCKTRIYA